VRWREFRTERLISTRADQRAHLPVGAQAVSFDKLSYWNAGLAISCAQSDRRTPFPAISQARFSESRMLLQSTQLRPGMIIEYNRELWRVMTIQHITPGNWRGMVQTKLRNIRTGSQTENRFRSEDKVERVILSQAEMEFLYQDGNDFHFMNTENYEQITIPKDMIEDVVPFLIPNMKVEVESHEGTPLNVTPPKSVAMKVIRTDPGMRSAAVTNTLKPATMETGLIVQVPHFVQEGEVITINTETREYQSRSK
jgi:elongation factor P